MSANQEKKKWSNQAHETWQIDGKEQVELGDKQEISWMNIADEGTGAHLKAEVHGCRTVAMIDLQQAIEKINKSFTTYGLPKKIKIDNGHPFVTPGTLDMPSYAKLWWIGLGIEVVQNRPRRPQENGMVECLQGIMYRWSNPKGCCIKTIQQRLDKESDFQRNHYRIPQRGGRTRKELYPELENNPRTYKAADFKIERIYEWLSNQVWTRKVSKSGDIAFRNVRIFVSKKLKLAEVEVTFDPLDEVWLIRAHEGVLLKTSSKRVPTKKEIWNFVFPKNKTV